MATYRYKSLRLLIFYFLIQLPISGFVPYSSCSLEVNIDSAVFRCLWLGRCRSREAVGAVPRACRPYKFAGWAAVLGIRCHLVGRSPADGMEGGGQGSGMAELAREHPTPPTIRGGRKREAKASGTGLRDARSGFGSGQEIERLVAHRHMVKLRARGEKHMGA